MRSFPITSPRTLKWARLLSQFLSGQIAIQALNFLTGFLLLRWLNVTAYAEFSVAFAFQSTLGMLIDLGFSNSIVALVGDRGSDADVVGRYIRSARHFRNRMLVVMAGVSLFAFPLMTRHQHWPPSTKLLLLGAVLASLFFQGWGMYAAPLLIHGRIKEFYQAQIVSAAGRLACCFLLFETAALSAWAAAWMAAAALAVNGLRYRKKSGELIAEPYRSDPVFNKEMLGYLAPLIPGVIFTAFQGQISVALITIFGHTKSIAEVAALGRLGQIFAVFAAVNSVIIEPNTARLSATDFKKRYLQIAFAAVILSIGISALGFLFPKPLLWLLGKNYAHLQREVGWVVMSACITYVSGVLWTMHGARKWVWWWSSFAYIGLLLVSQTVCFFLLDLSQTLNVVYYGVIVSLTVLVVHLLTGIVGFSRMKWVVEISPETTAAQPT